MNATYCETEEPVEVALDLTPPALEGPVDDHDVVLAIDHSGSMGGGPGSPLQEAIRAAKNFVRRLPTNIHAGIVTFNHQAELVNPISGQRKRVLRDIDTISPGGGTAIHKALDRCREALVESRTGVSKTAVLLSDGRSSRSAATRAARLWEAVPDVTVITIGFGGVDRQLMTELASEEKFYIHVDDTEDLYELFHGLAKVVSGQIAISGLMSEQVKAPHPIRLGRSAGLVPSGAHVEENTTRVVWQAPVMDPRSLRLHYEVAPLCPGWYPVATQEGSARWTMTDNTRKKQGAPSGPRLLVLPKRWGWAWWILNPLFWLLVDRFWTCEPPGAPPEEFEEEPEPLEEDVPEPLPDPPGPPYTLEPRPALVIGLGDVGRHTLCHLKWHLDNRNAPPSRVDVMSLDVLHPSNQAKAQSESVPLTSDERMPLHQDLRPYLEHLRALALQDEGVPLSRRWIPWRQWLADLDPLSTVRSLDDRRKARLALLLKPDAVENRLQEHIQRIREEEGQIIVTGSPSDPECSGMLAEVSHICATHHEAATVVFAPSNYADAGTQALAEEIERMMRENGSGVLSDRGSHEGESTVSAHRLFNRVVFASPDDTPSTVSGRAETTADLLWCMLAYGKDLDIPPVKHNEFPLQGTRIQYTAILPPAGILWEWVREDRLAQSINKTWLGLEVQHGRFSLPDPDWNTVQQDVEAFWTGRYNERPLNRLVGQSRRILQDSTIETILDLNIAEQANRPYHEQAHFAETERKMFKNYLAEWAHRILERERDERRCGLQRLWLALKDIETEFASVVDVFRDHTGSSPFSDTARLAVNLFADFESIRATLAQDVHCWLSYFVGSSPKLELEDTHEGQTPVCYDLEEARKEALRALSPSKELRREAQDAWNDKFEQSINNQLWFSIENGPDQRGLSLNLNFSSGASNESFDCQDEARLTQVLREVLNKYRRYVLEWVGETQFPSNKPIVNPDDRVRIGKKEDVFSSVRTVCNDEDPLVAAAIDVRKEEIKNILGITGRTKRTPPYAWPEEANARRLKNKIQNTLHLESKFPSSATHLLRDTLGLFGFMRDIADGDFRKSGHEYLLSRDETDFTIAQDCDIRLDTITTFAEQVVLIQKDLNGSSIPSPPVWRVEAEKAVKAVNNSPLGKQFARLSGWDRWESLIRGLALEHGKQ